MAKPRSVQLVGVRERAKYSVDLLRLVPDEAWSAAGRRVGWPEGEAQAEAEYLENVLENVATRDWVLVSRNELHSANKCMEDLIRTVGGGTNVSDRSTENILSSMTPNIINASRPLLSTTHILEQGIFDSAQKAERLAREAADAIESKIASVTEGEFERQAKLVYGQVEEAKSAAKAAREAAEQAGVASNARFFQEQAKAHKRASIGWLMATVLGAGATLTVLAWMLDALKGEGVDVSLAGAGLRVALVSFCAYLVAWCGKSYRAEKHNQVLNQRRQIALNTLDALTSAAGEDAQMKASIIGQVTAAIFGAASSGYGASEEPSPGPMSTLVEKVFQSRR